MAGDIDQYETGYHIGCRCGKATTVAPLSLLLHPLLPTAWLLLHRGVFSTSASEVEPPF